MPFTLERTAMRTLALIVTSVTALSLFAPALLAAPAAGQSAAPAARRATVDLRVASYNVRSVSLDQTTGEVRPWRERRQGVIANILGESVDVIGVQELNPSKAFASRLVDGRNQILDLRNGLNQAGGTFALTNRYAFNCKKPSTQYKCKKRNRGASHSDRILYNTQTVGLVDQGKLKYDAQVGKDSPAHMGWAVLRSHVNGAEFLFTTTHLDPKNTKVRAKQWREMIKKINKLKKGRPVIATGDFNTHKFSPMAQRFLPRMKEAGYGDVLNQQYRVTRIASPRAASTVNGWMNTANKFQRDVRQFGYWDEQFRAGNNIDWIWADNRLPVREYKVVTSWDPHTWQVNGVIPSDHNMVRATLGLG
jgi:endonuclease/exonuclease/phosphatase family metal-dependent hydrolase